MNFAIPACHDRVLSVAPGAHKAEPLPKRNGPCHIVVRDDRKCTNGSGYRHGHLHSASGMSLLTEGRQLRRWTPDSRWWYHRQSTSLRFVAAIDDLSARTAAF